MGEAVSGRSNVMDLRLRILCNFPCRMQTLLNELKGTGRPYAIMQTPGKEGDVKMISFLNKQVCLFRVEVWMP